MKVLTTDEIKELYFTGYTLEEISKRIPSLPCNICKGKVWFRQAPNDAFFSFHCPICGCENVGRAIVKWEGK